MKKCRYCSVVMVTVGLLLVILAFTFAEVSATDLAADGRTEIVVTSAERDRIRAEMRGFLEVVQTIIVANNAGDLNTVAVAARKVGKSSLRPHSPEFANKLPMEFRQLGMDTHLHFDTLAMDAEKLESMAHVSQQLGALMGNCVACHKTYRLTTDDEE